MSDDQLLRAVERVAQTLEATGMPRMAARVFAYVLIEDSDRYTATELGEGLNVSPAAISGAVRYLVDIGLVSKVREPGERSDIYRVYDGDVWRTIMAARLPLLDRFIESIQDAIDMVGSDHPGGQRLVETLEYFRFSRREMHAMLERWDEHRQTMG